MMRADFNDRNAHSRDQFLTFDPAEHVYYHNGMELRSVTNVIEEYFPRFDPEEWAPRVALREGVTPEEIIHRWAEEGRRARELGTAMHDNIEKYYLGEDTGDNTDAMRLFRLFASDSSLSPYRTEWSIYDEDYGIAGTLDFLELTPSGRFNLWDWKRSSKLVDRNGKIVHRSRYGKTGYHPFTNLHDCAYWHYALQLNIYACILERKYGIRVSSMTLGVFHPDYARPWVLSVPWMRDHVTALLSHRINRLPGCPAR